jgi:threonine/homoserine/homoserine lactone efflux protein
MGDFIPLVLIAVICGITPGPSTILAAGIGASHGFTRCIPHIAGTSLGYGLLALIAVSLLAALEQVLPIAEILLQTVGVAFLLWLAWRIARSNVGPVPEFPPIGLWTSTTLQWVNPKAWATVSAASALVPDMDPAMTPFAVAAAFVIFLPPGVACWASGGCAISHFLHSRKRRRLFNGTMSGALVALAAVGVYAS